ncbi:MAG: hypothetical protein ABI354_01805, partial [Candidatus Saccharimonadales bacterium]
VDMFEWRKATGPQTIGTIGLGPCVGVVLYSDTRKEGHVGHFVAPHIDAIDVEEMVESALEGGELSELTVWVRGGSIDTEYAEEGLDYHQETEDYLMALFARKGVTTLDMQLNLSPEISVDLVLDCETGTFKCTEENWE